VDELSFAEGDIIVITKEAVDDEGDNWMEGYLETSPAQRGIFPALYVEVLAGTFRGQSDCS
jgi:lipoate synthase